MKSEFINGIKIYIPKSSKALGLYAINKQKILIAVNALKVLNSNQKLRKIINCNIGYPDGEGPVWALRKKGFKNVKKIAGCEFWIDLIKDNFKNKTFYIVGGKQETIDKTIYQLKQEYSGIKILNHRNGFLKTDNEKKELIKDIMDKSPDIIFVAMGSPKQENLMYELHQHHTATYIGLGGSLDIYTGSLKRAPNYILKYKIEWLFRMIQEPKRIKQQISLLKFFLMVILRKY